MISKETNVLIGQCGLLVREVENEFELEIAYSILPQFRGQGFEIWLELFKDENTAKMLGMDGFKTQGERCEKWFE